MAHVLVGTDDGVRTLDGKTAAADRRSVTALVSDGATWSALLDGRHLVRDAMSGGAEPVAVPEPLRGTCLLTTSGGMLVGTSEARLLRLAAGELEGVEGFDRVAGRDGWYTPWGGPPDTRSMSEGPDGTIYVNVHVGGIPVSNGGGESFEPTIDVDSDVHQVVADQERAGRAMAATAIGLAESSDGGSTWSVADEGLHAPYCRSIAVAGDAILLSASTGPRGNRAALYRRPREGHAPFERCRGLPEWFDGNIDTHCLAASGDFVAFGMTDGRVFVSEDAGITWSEAADGLPPVRCVVIEPG